MFLHENLQIYLSFSQDRDIHFYLQGTRRCTYLRIEAVSNISAMNVETPFNWLSPAPTRAKMQSTMDTSADSHGTKHPIWAMSTITPVCRIYVDLPPILGPTKQIISEIKILNFFLLLINGLLVLSCTMMTNHVGSHWRGIQKQNHRLPKDVDKVTAHITPKSNAIISSDKLILGLSSREAMKNIPVIWLWPRKTIYTFPMAHKAVCGIIYWFPEK